MKLASIPLVIAAMALLTACHNAESEEKPLTPVKTEALQTYSASETVHYSANRASRHASDPGLQSRRIRRCYPSGQRAGRFALAAKRVILSARDPCWRGYAKMTTLPGWAKPRQRMRRPALLWLRVKPSWRKRRLDSSAQNGTSPALKICSIPKSLTRADYDAAEAQLDARPQGGCRSQFDRRHGGAYCGCGLVVAQQVLRLAILKSVLPWMAWC